MMRKCYHWLWNSGSLISAKCCWCNFIIFVFFFENANDWFLSKRFLCLFVWFFFLKGASSKQMCRISGFVFFSFYHTTHLIWSDRHLKGPDEAGGKDGPITMLENIHSIDEELGQNAGTTRPRKEGTEGGTSSEDCHLDFSDVRKADLFLTYICLKNMFLFANIPPVLVLIERCSFPLFEWNVCFENHSLNIGRFQER